MRRWTGKGGEGDGESAQLFPAAKAVAVGMRGRREECELLPAKEAAAGGEGSVGDVVPREL